jgi:hypothetical protein
MEGFKSYYKSRTLIGVAISLVGKLLAVYFGSEVLDENSQAVIVDGVEKIVNAPSQDLIYVGASVATSVIGDFLSGYGRIKATKKLGK